MLSALLVEDDPDIQRVVRLALRRAEIDVSVVETGEAALAAVSAHPPDIILLDSMMPGLDGVDTCARLKADPATRDIPVIFLSAKSQDADVARGLAAGAVGYITKPFDTRLLGARVRAFLGR